MTQEIQPLTWSKRTNIEEHQQFFSKINEIIGNLAPTVDEAEQAIAQATAAIASANDAVATANAASAAASAAASQAQTAASTVAGYDTRLTAAEGDIAAIEGREPDYLKKTGATQTVTSQIMVPTAATGLRDTQIANGTRIQNDLDAYVPMVRTTGNQTKAGNLTFTGSVISKRAQNNPHLTMINDNIASVNDMNTAWSYPIIFRAENNDELGHLTFGRNGSGKSYLTLTLVASDGTSKTITLGVND